MHNSMHRGDVAKWWMILSGVAVLIMGGLAYVDSNLVGTRPDAVFAMTPMHGAAHAVAGLATIGIGLALSGRARAAATLLTGVAFMVAFALNMASPDFWGRMDMPVNNAVHIMHFTMGVLSLAAGFVASTEAVHRQPMLIHGSPLR